MCVCVCVCVCEWEREQKGPFVCVLWFQRSVYFTTRVTLDDGCGPQWLIRTKSPSVASALTDPKKNKTYNRAATWELKTGNERSNRLSRFVCHPLLDTRCELLLGMTWCMTWWIFWMQIGKANTFSRVAYWNFFHIRKGYFLKIKPKSQPQPVSISVVRYKNNFGVE